MQLFLFNYVLFSYINSQYTTTLDYDKEINVDDPGIFEIPSKQTTVEDNGM